jgi:hypothetical protein
MEPAGNFNLEALRSDVEADRDLLYRFADEASNIAPEDDPKLTALVDELAEIAAEAERDGLDDEHQRDLRKVLVFSYYKDTVDLIDDRLADIISSDDRLAAYRNRHTAVAGGDSGRARIVWGFAPKTTDPPSGHADDKFDILVTTDVLAEGVNLQQCRHIINYDLPWNPMRLVQRHGRIDRIGSPHSSIVMRCVFPDKQLEDLLGLEDRLQHKIKHAAVSIGIGGEIIPGSKVDERSFANTREEIRQLRDEQPDLFEDGGRGDGAISGEEYRQELKQQIQDKTLADRVSALAWGSGSGFALASGDPGYVFCIRVGDHPEPLYRFVPTSGPDGQDVHSDTLACLARSIPPAGATTVRVMSEEILQGAFTAWETSRNDVVESWNYRADPANIAPETPKAMRSAAELIRDHATGVLDLPRQRLLLDIIESPRPERVLRDVRDVLRMDATSVEKVHALDALVNEQGLEPVPRPIPMPEITHDDVHLICWLAVTRPEDAT